MWTNDSGRYGHRRRCRCVTLWVTVRWCVHLPFWRVFEAILPLLALICVGQVVWCTAAWCDAGDTVAVRMTVGAGRGERIRASESCGEEGNVENVTWTECRCHSETSHQHARSDQTAVTFFMLLRIDTVYTIVYNIQRWWKWYCLLCDNRNRIEIEIFKNIIMNKWCF